MHSLSNRCSSNLSFCEVHLVPKAPSLKLASNCFCLASHVFLGLVDNPCRKLAPTNPIVNRAPVYSQFNSRLALISKIFNHLHRAHCLLSLSCFMLYHMSQYNA